MLAVKGLSAGYDAGNVLHDVTLEVAAGQVVSVIGANGAGKSTLLRALSGVISPSAGQVFLDGHDLTGLPTQALLRRGLVHVPEGRHVFPQLSVRDNLELGAYARRPRRAAISEGLARVFEILPDLEPRMKVAAGALSGGQQQMLAIGRALMTGAKCLLLDEPSLGLAPKVIQAVFDVVRELRNAGNAVLMVEQNGNMALSASDVALVLDQGQVVMSGTAKSLQGNDEVIAKYLGLGEGGADIESVRDLGTRLRAALDA